MTKPSKDKVNEFPELQPGDILLYSSGLLGWLIRLRTWGEVSHVEVYAGEGRSMASRAHGPRLYPLNIMGLRRVMRPARAFNFAQGWNWFLSVADKLPYGYLDLLNFYGIHARTKGLICSQFADLFFWHCDLDLFSPRYSAGTICPRDFETLSPLLAREIWSYQ